MGEPGESPRLRDQKEQAARPIASGSVRLLLAIGIVVAVLATGIAWARSVYLGPGPGIADRVRAAHDPLVVAVEFTPNPFGGAPGRLSITLAHGATRDEVNAFWCGVVVPAGGEGMYRDGDLALRQADQQAYEVGRLEPSLTCPPLADARPWVDPTPTPTEGPPFIYGSCDDTFSNPFGDCDAEREAALLAVSHLGPYPLSVVIRPGGFPCGEPFETRQPAETCVRTPGALVAYVLFVGTDKVAAVSLSKGADGYTGTVVSFEKPPSSFDHYFWRPPTPDGSPSAEPSGS
jgi:hypothetical protein